MDRGDHLSAPPDFFLQLDRDQSGFPKLLLESGNSFLNLRGSCLGSDGTHYGGRQVLYRIAGNRDKFSPIPVIFSEILTAISWDRYRSAIAVCKSQPDPDNDSAAERSETKQLIYSYRVRVRGIDDRSFHSSVLDSRWWEPDKDSNCK